MSDNRTIELVLDLETGETIEAESFFKQSDEVIFKLRMQLEIEIRNGTKRYVCLYCKQHIKLRGRVGSKVIMHFAHLKDSNDCPIKTGSKYSLDEIKRIKYNGAKESKMHFELKHFIAEKLSSNSKRNKGISEVAVEAVKKDLSIPKSWKKPDISAIYNDIKVVFELQLSTTFLSVITERQEFYKRNKIYMLWVFRYFEEDEDKRKFMQSDIFFNNNQNGFELDSEAQEYSNERNDLVLCCHYIFHERNGNIIQDVWKREYITLNDLTFNMETFQVYFFDVEANKKKLEYEILSEKEICINYLDSESLNGLIANFQIYPVSNTKMKVLNIMYNKYVKSEKYISRDGQEINLVWLIILYKLYSKSLFDKFLDDYPIRIAIQSILSLKLNKIIGYGFKSQTQIAHNLLNRNPEFCYYYERGIKVYKNLGKDNKNKLQKKIKRIKDQNIKQRKNDTIIEMMFPGLKT